MVKFVNESYDNQVLTIKVRGKMIIPAGKEKLIKLKDYQGIFAANLTF